MRFADLDAVTIDAYGTLVRLHDPVPALVRALRERGIDRTPAEVTAAFQAEGEYYVPRSLQGRDEKSLAELHRDCTAVFLAALDADLDAESFSETYVGTLEFEAEPGAVEALASLRARGLELAVVSNWDISLHDHLARLGLDHFFRAVVTSADVGVAKPGPAIFRAALERITVPCERTLHVGDRDIDEGGARAAGLVFAPAPLASLLDVAA